MKRALWITAGLGLLWLPAGSLDGCADGSRAAARAAPASDSGLVYVRVKGQPDIDLVGPGGKSVRARKGVVLQNDFPGQAEAYSVPPTTQIAFKNPPEGRWKLRVRGNEQRRQVVTVLRSLDSGRKVCDAADTVFIGRNDSQWWDLRWSGEAGRDTCWVGMTRSKAPAGSETRGLTIHASGARRIEVVDPLGRRMLRDVRTGESISEIPGASMEGLASEHDSGENLDDAFSGYDLDMPTAVDGHYTVRIHADAGLSMSVTAYGDSGVLASEAAIDTTAGHTSNVYDILYSGSSRSVTVRTMQPRTQR